jgi:hypothetical protein
LPPFAGTSQIEHGAIFPMLASANMKLTFPETKAIFDPSNDQAKECGSYAFVILAGSFPSKGRTQMFLSGSIHPSA